MIGMYTNPFWDKTITIYTKYFDPTTKKTTWHHYKAYNCFFSLKKNNDIKLPDIVVKHEYIARIPHLNNYLSYSEWCNSDDKENNISITTGSLIVNADIATAISENQSGNILLELYKDKSFRVSSFKENSSYMIRHYYAEGE